MEARADTMASLPDEVVAWCLSLDDASGATGGVFEAGLDDREREAVARFARADDRSAAGAVRLLAKHLLASVTATVPGDWRLDRTDAGAPIASGPAGLRPPHLSLSRTHGAVAAAVSGGAAVGVDIERLAAGGADVAEALFAPADRATIAGAGADAFTRVWTVKEAVLKAMGTGFALPPDHVGVLSLDPPRIGFAPGYAEAPDWTVRCVARGSARIAVACRAGGVRVAIRFMRVAGPAPLAFEVEP